MAAGASVQTDSVPPNEQSWVITKVVQDGVQMAALAAKAADPLSTERTVTVKPDPVQAGQTPSYSVAIQLGPEGNSIQSTIKPKGTVWSAETYRDIFGQILKSFKLTPPADSPLPKEDSLGALNTPISVIIQSENRRVSGLLTAEPLNPELHEQAALICAVLGLKEQARQWWDPRLALNRATAHLAMASALRQGSGKISDSGLVANLIMGVLMDTTAENTKQIRALETLSEKNSGLKPWIVAAKIRNTRDWRLLQTASQPTMLELLEGFRAQCENMSSQAALKAMGKLDVDSGVDWSRIILQFSTSVQLSHRFDRPAVEKEFKDIAATFGKDRIQKMEDIFTILNTEPGGAVQKNKDNSWGFQVLDDGIWAQFFQRHLLYATYDTKIYLRDRWGVKEAADQFVSQVESLFTGFSLFPLYRGWETRDSTQISPADRQALARLMTGHPEKINERMWRQFDENVKLNPEDGYRDPAPRAWFDPVVPTGTAFTAVPRIFFLEKANARNPEFLKPYLEIAPDRLDLKYAYVKIKYGEQPSIDVIKAEFGDALDFNIALMKLAAKQSQNDPVAYPEQLAKIAGYDPDEFVKLAEYYVLAKKDSKAAEAYQEFFDKATDRVHVANKMSWLVKYYEANGKPDQATTIAEDVARTYSGTGLETMAELQESRGKISEAESYYLKIKERYNDQGPLQSFYERQVGDHPEYAGPMAELKKGLFPNGLKKVALADFTGAPASGVRFDGASALMEKVGLKVGAIIVAIDGSKVDTMEQYMMLRSTNPSPMMKLIVYQDGAYRELEASPPEKRFGVEISTYPKK